MSFPTKVTPKLIANVAHHTWVMIKMFHSILPETALLNDFFNLFILLKNIRFVSYMKELCKNHLEIFLIKLSGIPHTRRKGTFASIKTL